MCECDDCREEQEDNKPVAKKSDFIPDWNMKYRTKEDMESDVGIVFCGDGWYVREKDHALIFEEDGWWYVAMFNNRTDPMRMFVEIGNLPIQR